MDETAGQRPSKVDEINTELEALSLSPQFEKVRAKATRGKKGLTRIRLSVKIPERPDGERGVPVTPS